MKKTIFSEKLNIEQLQLQLTAIEDCILELKSDNAEKQNKKLIVSKRRQAIEIENLLSKLKKLNYDSQASNGAKNLVYKNNS